MIAPMIYPKSKYHWSDTRTMMVRLGIVPNALFCGVVAAQRITRRPWIGATSVLMAPPLRRRRLWIYQGECPAGPGACRRGMGVERGSNIVSREQAKRGQNGPCRENLFQTHAASINTLSSTFMRPRGSMSVYIRPVVGICHGGLDGSTSYEVDFH